MQDVIRECIDNLSNQYPSDSSAILQDSPVIDVSNLISAISDMVSEFSQSRVVRECNISPELQTKLDKLVIIYEILDEYGYLSASKAEEIDNIEPCKREATIQLRMLYLRVLDEVIYLLEGGYSSAAFGRARTIYEIGVFLEIISKNNESIAKSFLDHSNYARLQYVKQFCNKNRKNRLWQGLLTLNPDELFLNNYKWAAPLFKKDTIYFRDLARITSLKRNYSFYVASSHSVHATILDSRKGIGISKEEKGKSIWITTPSENGIEFVIKILCLFSEKTVINHFPCNDCAKVILSIIFSGLYKSDSELVELLK